MLPLENIKVLDVARFAPGLYCGMMMGDLGADVLRIDQPAATFESDAGEVEKTRAAAGLTLNRNKRSIVLNLKLARGLQIFHRLCRDADVLIEGFRPGVTERLGIEYESLREVNPRLVYCSITGYGQTGPYRDLPGHDINYISIAGALSIIGQRGGAPAIPVNLLGDYAGGGLQGLVGILTALLVREKTGAGQHIDISMTDGVVSLLAAEYANYFADAVPPERAGTRLSGGVPYYNVYETRDHQYISLACSEAKFWRNLCHAVGRDDLIPSQFDPARREEIFAAFTDIFLTRTRDDWFEFLGKQDVCVSKVLNLEEASSDPQLLARQAITRADFPRGPAMQVGIPVKLSATPGSIRNPAPAAGQHTDEVLRALGYSQAEIKTLRHTGIVA